MSADPLAYSGFVPGRTVSGGTAEQNRRVIEEEKAKKEAERLKRLEEELQRKRDLSRQEAERLRQEKLAELKRKLAVKQEKEISPYKQTEFLTREEALGVRGRLTEIGRRLKEAPRRILVEGEFTTLGGLTEGAELKAKTGGVTASIYPKGGTEFEGRESTLEEIQQTEEVAREGKYAGQPEEFVVQDIARTVSGEAQQELDKEAEKLQEEIDRGNITIEQAEQILKEKQTVIESKAQDKFERKSADFLQKREITKAIRRSTRTDVSGVATAGIIAGLTIASPIAGSVALGLGGMETATKSLGKASLNESLTTTERFKLLGKAGIGLSEAGIGVSGISTRILKQIDQAKLQALRESETKILGIEKLRTKEGSILKITGFKETGGAKAITEQKILLRTTSGGSPLKDLGKIKGVADDTVTKSFTLVGKGKTKTIFFSELKDKFILSETAFSSFGRGEISPTVAKMIYKRGGLTATEQVRGFKASYGSGGVTEKFTTSMKELPTKFKGFPLQKSTKRIRMDITTPEKPLTTFTFGGVAKREKGFIKIAGGLGKKLRFGYSGERSLLTDRKVIGIIKEFQPKKDKGFKIFFGGRSQTPLTKTFQLTETQATQITGLGEAGLQRGISNLGLRTIKRRALTRVPITETKQKSVQRPILYSGKTTFEGKFKSLGVLGTAFGTVSGQSTRQKTRLKTQTRTKLKERNAFVTPQAQSLGLSQSLRQRQRLRLSLKQRQRLRTGISQVTPYGFGFGRIGVSGGVGGGFFYPTTKRGRRISSTRRKYGGTQSMVIVGGTAERQLGITRVIKRKDLLKEAKTEGIPFKVRGIPIIK